MYAVHVQVGDAHFARPNCLKKRQITAGIYQKFMGVSTDHKLSLVHPFYPQNGDISFINFG
jgi:hypothetical protein